MNKQEVERGRGYADAEEDRPREEVGPPAPSNLSFGMARSSRRVSGGACPRPRPGRRGRRATGRWDRRPEGAEGAAKRALVPTSSSPAPAGVAAAPDGTAAVEVGAAPGQAGAAAPRAIRGGIIQEQAHGKHIPTT